jgi:hypothetical protein
MVMPPRARPRRLARRVLIVDDSDDTLLRLEREVERRGIDVSFVSVSHPASIPVAVAAHQDSGGFDAAVVDMSFTSRDLLTGLARPTVQTPLAQQELDRLEDACRRDRRPFVRPRTGLGALLLLLESLERPVPCVVCSGDGADDRIPFRLAAWATFRLAGNLPRGHVDELISALDVASSGRATPPPKSAKPLVEAYRQLLQQPATLALFRAVAREPKSAEAIAIARVDPLWERSPIKGAREVTQRAMAFLEVVMPESTRRDADEDEDRIGSGRRPGDRSIGWMRDFAQATRPFWAAELDELCALSVRNSSRGLGE